MKTPMLHLLVAATLAILVAGTASASTVGREGGRGAHSANPGVIPPQAMTFGMSYAEWGVKWWRWALSSPCASNPILDVDGSFSAVNQSGPVWFLAGGVPTTRTSTVPAGDFLFFPLINVENDYPCPDPNFHPDPGQSLEDFLTNGSSSFPGAKDYIDPTSVLEAEIDGRSLHDLFNYRATSGLHTFTGDPSLATCFDPCITGTEQPAVTDGYWLMLAPLSVGHHTIHYHAVGVFEQEETYNLDVVQGTAMMAASEGSRPLRAVGSIGTFGGSAGALRTAGVIHTTTAKELDARRGSWGRLKMVYR